MGSIPGLGRSPGGGHGNPLQYSLLENPMDRGAWQATDHVVAKSDMTEGLSMHGRIFSCGVWDLGSEPGPPCVGSRVLATGPPGKFPRHVGSRK